MTYLVRFQDRSLLLADSTLLKVEKDGGSIANMQVPNLKPGLRALIETEYIPQTAPGQLVEIERPIEVIEEGLENIPIYQLARRTLFKQDENDEVSKILRYGLIKGFGHAADIEPDDLERKIYSEGMPEDLSPREYSLIAGAIRSILEQAVDAGRLSRDSLVERNTINYTWLRGPTYFPDDWNTLGVLAANCPEFLPYYESFADFGDFSARIRNSKDYYTALGLDTQNPNLFGCYLFFIGARSVEARIASPPKGSGASARARQSTNSLFNYADITEQVRRYFKEQVTKEYSLAVVLDVKKIEDSRQPKKTKIPDPNFARGVYTGEGVPKGSGLSFISPNGIYTDYCMLDFVFKNWVEHFVNVVARDVWRDRIPSDAPIVRTIAKDELSASVNVYSEGISKTIDAIVRAFDGRTAEMYDALKIGIEDAIDRNVPDTIQVVSPGTFKRLSRKLDEITRFLPGEFGELSYLMYADNANRGSLLEKSRKRKRQTQLVEQVRNRFGINLDSGDLILDTGYQYFGETFDRHAAGLKDESQLLTASDRDTVIVSTMKKSLAEKDVKFLRYSDVRQRLIDLELVELMKFFNFGLYEKFDLV